MEKQIMISVKAAPGTRCPMEHNPREYVADDKAQDVPGTVYYRRLIDDGSLIAQDLTAKKPGKGATAAIPDAAPTK